ncbi:MAG: hypothetical protein A2Y73_06215 [Chloroflexi bacterium RBG_13_56_8]|nr:MAG: hypothetical protein A2Y73_06215 [Chloroflexi bacterium RBG_13_56_8]
MWGLKVILPITLAFAALLYWLLVVTEGTYLGKRFFTLLYDWSAGSYDRIKDLRYVDESLHLGIPLTQSLEHIPSPWVLDVATGTGRVLLALLRTWGFGGVVIGVDRSVKMLHQAQKALADSEVILAQGDAEALSFRDETFDCVTCLESLEFMGHPNKAIGEMVRVLKPGGVLLISNRVGNDAWLFPRRLRGRGQAEQCLHERGMEEVRMQRWQVHYDLIWAYKGSKESLSAPYGEPKAEGLEFGTMCQELQKD